MGGQQGGSCNSKQTEAGSCNSKQTGAGSCSSKQTGAATLNRLKPGVATLNRLEVIFNPSQWNTVIQTAQSAAPYVVVPLNHEDNWDFKKKKVATSSLRNTKTDMTGDRVNWWTIKWLHCLKDDPETLLFKYRITDGFKQLKIKGTSTRWQTDILQQTSATSLWW